MTSRSKYVRVTLEATKYIPYQRLINPSLPKNTLKKIILDGGQYELKPERRFDAAVVSYLT